ncbi:DNA-binding protein [Lysobacter sp. TLK-CK17T]|uniref:DNA-binding protein n=1 Tax=Marilutibacter chinensis TaxID=2912247 RepID=A0ABS9HXK8_9GAMM|nr:DNA-binding protein [Lysobacter chinensis]MCF7223107.1 DNA-binding protein [Lysobacter chinensis]
MHHVKSNRVRSADEVRKDFERKGITIMSFARDHGLSPGIVYQLLSGQKKGRRGEAHRAAVLLGMKEGVIEQGADA